VTKFPGTKAKKFQENIVGKFNIPDEFKMVMKLILAKNPKIICGIWRGKLPQLEIPNMIQNYTGL